MAIFYSSLLFAGSTRTVAFAMPSRPRHVVAGTGEWSIRRGLRSLPRGTRFAPLHRACV